MKPASAQPGVRRRETPTTVLAQRRQITVLFADIPGFTGIAGKLDAEEVHDFLNAVWSRLDGIIIRHGGTIDKHMGDGLMALFGAKVSHEEDPEHAVRAALEMQATTQEFQPRGAATPLQIRVGVHTGLVLLGQVGTTREFTATGDAVNLASHFEREAPPGGILISHETYQQVCGLFDVEVIPRLTLKGKNEPVQAYRVLNAKPRPVLLRTRGIQGVDRQMVGRKQELKRLQDAFRAVAQENRARVFTILGEPGIGKSCLVQEFLKWVELLPGYVRLFSARATAEGAGVPFALVRDLFRFRFQILENDPLEVASRKFEEGLGSFVAGSSLAKTPHELEAQRLALAGLLGFNDPGASNAREQPLDSTQVRHRAFDFLTKFFRAVSRSARLADDPSESRSALVVFDDIHWSDDESLDLIEHLAVHCRDAPLMILCLARPELLERRATWGKKPGWHEQIVLNALTRDEGLLMVETILRKTPEIPKPLPDLVVTRAEGNPFWIEEIIKMLIDERVIQAGQEQWRIKAGPLAATKIPATLTGVIQARLDGLSQTERLVLQRASVVGRGFWDRAILALTAPPGSQGSSGQTTVLLDARVLSEALRALQVKDLVVKAASSVFADTLQYHFKHELLCDAVYETVLKKTRRHYHGQIANWLIEQSGSRVCEFGAIIARHLEHADRPSEAAEWYARAGQHARFGYAPAGAIELFQNALRLMPTGSPNSDSLLKRLELQQELADVLGAQARFTEAIQACLAARSLAEQTGNPVAQARTWNGLAFLQERLGENRESIRSADHAEQLLRNAGQLTPVATIELIRALHLKGWAFYRLGDAKNVLALADHTARLCENSGERQRLAVSYKLRGVAHLQLGQFAEARRWFESGLRLSEELGDRRNVAAMLSNLGETARIMGDFQTAATLYERALGVSREIGHRESELIYLSNLAGAKLGLGRFKEAEASLREVIASVDSPTSCSLAETYWFLSEACSAQGRFQEAWDAAQRALSLASNSANLLDTGGGWRALARAAAGLQGQGKALPSASASDPRVFFQESFRVFKHISAEAEQARTLQAWADYESQIGEPLESSRLREQAEAIAARLGLPSWALVNGAQLPIASGMVLPDTSRLASPVAEARCADSL